MTDPSTTPAQPVTDPRTQFAAERTLLAWIRTGLALMGFGFVVARFGLFLRELAASRQLAPHSSTGFSFWVGTALIVTGVLVMIAATYEHTREIKRLRSGADIEFHVSKLAVALTATLAIVGLALTFYLVWNHPG